MKTKTPLLSVIAVALLAAGMQKSSGMTVPAGTILSIRTLTTVTSVDVPGTPVRAQLERPVAVNGKVALPAGTELSAKVITSRRLVRSTDRLTIDLISLHLPGRNVPITTAGPQLLTNGHRTRNDVSISRVGYAVAAGKTVHFQLARPLTF